MTKTPKLAPVVAKTAKAAASMAQQENRKRPIVAINEEGKLVVCCRRTARKNGWEVQDVLYERNKPAKAATKKTPQRRKTDTGDVAEVSKAKLKKVKTAVDSTVDEILGN